MYLTRGEIEKQVKMSIPIMHKEKYLDLLFKNRSVISKDKSDLGMAKNFFHRIVLKDKDLSTENNIKFQKHTLF